MWAVTFSRRAAKQVKALGTPQFVVVIERLLRLVADIRANGPVRRNWRNFTHITNGGFHCHIRRGKPTYVAVWYILNEVTKKVEITYVGTHEGAPY
ncbi:MAG: cytotoxic translational repressor of toxin-antitoxin stability system [Oxalobacteraceae bacterium]|nr:MAG: cytotoxic translational repressor of toxin-antitoxin stability system [Oxalobacteraceae bacterium]